MATNRWPLEVVIQRVSASLEVNQRVLWGPQEAQGTDWGSLSIIGRGKIVSDYTRVNSSVGETYYRSRFLFPGSIALGSFDVR